MDHNRKGLLASILSYPAGVFFMLGNEFCERFSFYGMRAILTIYFKEEHKFSDSQASLFYHSFIALAYFSPLLGSIAADNYFGRFRVILLMSIVYVMGHVLVTVGAIPGLGVILRLIFDFGGLAVIAVATGGIKPCVSAFAADQFDETQEHERNQFFSFFYLAINAGSLIAILVTPMLREQACLGSDRCFPLAFGVPGVLMFLAFIFFLTGAPFYKKVPPAKGNIVFKVICCMCYAIREKIRSTFRGQGQNKVAHWVDYAAPKYSIHFLNGVKSLLSVSVLFGPIVLFWALFDQQGSTWVLQARHMDGRVGPFLILPDQMHIFNPLIVLIMVPVFEAWLYPAIGKFCKVTSLRKMATGGCLIALSFVVAGLLQLKVKETMELLPGDGRVVLQVFGNSSHSYEINGTRLCYGKTELSGGFYTIASHTEENVPSFQLDLSNDGTGYVLGVFESPEKRTSFSSFNYSAEKTENGGIRLYFLVADDSILANRSFYIVDSDGNVHKSATIKSGEHLDIRPALISSPEYIIKIGSGNCTVNGCPYNRTFHAQAGSAHVVYISENITDVHTIVRPNTIGVLWQLPQIFLITVGEVLFSVTGLEFSYSQAPASMKSILQAIWLMTVFFGNVIDMMISGSHLVADPATEFFIYALMTAIVIGIFIALATKFKYNKYSGDENAHTAFIYKLPPQEN